MIKIENLTKMYQLGPERVTGVRDVSLTMDKGETVVLAGPSGSGKTTLLNLIGALMRPDEGKIEVNGKELSQLTDAELSEFRLRYLGFVFQEYNLIPTLNAFENIEWVLALKKDDPKKRTEKVEAMLDRVGLLKYKKHRPNQMSRGQQQRVAIARALVIEPQLILADEMTANLDSKTAYEIMDFIADLSRKQKITFLYTSHDPEMIRRASRVFRMKDGRLDVSPQSAH